MERMNRPSTAALKIGATAALAFVLLAACACSASGGGNAETSGDSAAAPSTQVQPGSMLAVHSEDQLELIDGDYSKKSCLSCHPRDTIVAATEDYGGEEGFNPHAAHTESYDCTKCHSIEATSVLVCNTACHGGYHGEGYGWPLPEEGWADPTDDLPAADGVAVA